MTGAAGEYQTPDWGGDIVCGSCHKGDGPIPGGGHPGSTTLMDSGSHAKHLQYSFYAKYPTLKCMVCHQWNTSIWLNPVENCWSQCHSAKAPKHANGVVDVLFHTRVGSATYSGTSGTPGDGFGSCSNTYCHGGYSGSGLNATPVWGQTGSVTCGSCHGATNANPPMSGSHSRHANSSLSDRPTYNRGYQCSLCHADVVNGAGEIISQAKHASFFVDVKFNTADSRITGSSVYSIASGSEAASDGTTRAYGSCSKVYCHSNVQPNGGVGEPDNYGSPTWGTWMVCAGCHSTGWNGELPVYHGEDISSGSHTRHLAYEFGVSSTVSRCMVCHNSDGNASPGCNNCHGTLTEKEHHVDGNVDVKFYSGFVSSGANYNGTPKPGDGYSTCANTYCHSNGTSTTSISSNGTPTWGRGGLACTSCHNYSSESGAPIVTGSHSIHVISYVSSCSVCHTTTTTDGQTIASTYYHVNRTKDVAWDAVNSDGGSVCLLRVRQYLLPQQGEDQLRAV